jgi:AcrR family transcriptional regulator
MTEKKISTPSQNRSREAKERIILAAFELFSSRGIMDVTAKMIAEKAEVAIGSLYVYFRDKNDITKAVLARYNEMFLDMDYETIIRAESNIIVAIEKILIKLRDSLSNWNIPLIEIQMLESKDPEILNLIDDFNEKILNLSKDLITKTRLPLRQHDIDMASSFVFLIIDGYLFRWPFFRKMIQIETLTHEAAVTIATYLFGDQINDGAG